MPRPNRIPLAAALALLLILVSLGRGSPTVGLAPASAAPLDARSPAADDRVTATVTWNGVNVADASSASTAFSIRPGQSVEVQFRYAESSGADPVANASLLLLYAGLTMSAESIVTAPVGLFGATALNWTFGSLIYITEGVYEVTAELLDANGTILYSGGFFVDAHAPYVVGSLIALMATLLGIVEVFFVRSVIRYRRPRRPRYLSE